MSLDIVNHIYGYLEKNFWIDILFDGRYPIKRNSYDCSLIIMDAFWKILLLDITQVKKEQKLERVLKNESTSSVNLEGIALEKGLKMIKKVKVRGRNICVRKYYHDAVGKAKNIIAKNP